MKRGLRWLRFVLLGAMIPFEVSLLIVLVYIWWLAPAYDRDASALPTIMGAALWTIGVAAAFVCAFMIFTVGLASRLRRRVVSASGLACERCLYDLSQLAESGACPECGQAYEHGALLRKWVAWDRGIRDELAERTEPTPSDTSGPPR